MPNGVSEWSQLLGKFLQLLLGAFGNPGLVSVRSFCRRLLTSLACLGPNDLFSRSETSALREPAVHVVVLLLVVVVVVSCTLLAGLSDEKFREIALAYFGNL